MQDSLVNKVLDFQPRDKQARLLILFQVLLDPLTYSAIKWVLWLNIYSQLGNHEREQRSGHLLSCTEAEISAYEISHPWGPYGLPLSHCSTALAVSPMVISWSTLIYRVIAVGMLWTCKSLNQSYTGLVLMPKSTARQWDWGIISLQTEFRQDG